MPRHWKDSIADSFNKVDDSNSEIKALARIADSDGNVITVDSTGRVRTIEYKNYNSLEIEKTTVGTSATEIQFPNGTSFQIFHQTSGAKLYYKSDSTVDATDPCLRAYDVLTLDGLSSFSLYGLATENITVFVQASVKE